MAVEKFNRKPWHDNPNHAGRHSHEMRKQSAEAELALYFEGLATDLPEEPQVNIPIYTSSPNSDSNHEKKA